MKILVICLLLVINLTGCSEDKKVEDIAKSFSLALSQADMKSINSIVTKSAQEKVGKLTISCSQEEYENLSEEAFRIFNKKNRRTFKKYSRKAVETEIDNPEKQDALEKTLREKYPDIEKMPKEKSSALTIKYLMPIMKAKVIIPSLDKMFQINEIKTERPNEIKDVLAEAALAISFKPHLQNKEGFKVAILEASKNKFKVNSTKITTECVAKNTVFGSIKEVNLIEIKSDSADLKNVRLELITNNKKSSKVNIGLEKIINEWKVVSF